MCQSALSIYNFRIKVEGENNKSALCLNIHR